MSGGLQRFAIDMDRDSIVNLVKKVTLDVSGSGMSQESQSSLRDNLESFSFSGILWFDPKDSNISDLTLSVSQSGVLLGNLTLYASPSKTELHLNSLEDNSNIVFLVTKKDSRSDMNITLTQEDTEIGRLSWYLIEIKRISKKYLLISPPMEYLYDLVIV